MIPQMIKDVNVNLYKPFIATYTSGSISIAARTIGATPSAICRSIRELENQLGCQRLFERQGRGVVPSTEASVIYPKIMTAFNLISEAGHSIKEFNKDSEVVIRMGVSPALVNIILKDFLRDFLKKYPKVRFEFLDHNNPNLLKDGKLDLIVNVDSKLSGNDFGGFKLYEDESVFISSMQYLQSRGLSKSITKEDLSKVSIIGVSYLFEKFKTENELVSLNPIQNSPSESVYALVKSGLGVGFFYKKLLSLIDNDHDVVKLDVAGCNTTRYRYVCCYNKSNLSNPARKFIEMLKEFCNKYLNA